MEYLPSVELETNPAERSTASVIWLHGLGASGKDFLSLIPQLGLPATLAVRFIFPQAAELPITINGGYVMPAWYDILELNIERRVDHAQLGASAQAIKALINREIERGINSKKIILAGFSQGGAVVYHLGLTYEQPLAGLLILSSYFASHEHIDIHEANQSTPILIQHGTKDAIVTEALGRRAFQILSNRGCSVEYELYEMEHTISFEQVSAIAQWIQKVLQ